MFYKKDFKKVGYRIFVINSMPRGLFLIRMFFSQVHSVFICARTYIYIFDYFYKNMDGNPTRDARARAVLSRAELIAAKTVDGSSPVRINASVVMGRESE